MKNILILLAIFFIGCNGNQIHLESDSQLKEHFSKEEFDRLGDVLAPYGKMGTMQPGINIHQAQIRLGNTKSYFTLIADQYVDLNGNLNPNINFSESMTITKPLFKSSMEWTFMGSTRYYDQYRWGVPTQHFNQFKNYMYR